MNNYSKIENILNVVKSKIDAHIKFKNEYDKQLAFDFSLFQFFNVGENKISQVLAYFLDVHQNHGQGDIFLKEFVKSFYEEKIEIRQLNNICEKTITANRRLDIYIELEDLIIGIENKVWANDQPNQLRDYSRFLEQKSNGKYLLIYLNPYGLEPDENSISEKLMKTLTEEKKFNIISYKNDIIPLINNWIAICEADNVSHFLKEFKKYLEIKFLGKNTLNMSKELRTVIYDNEREVQKLVNEYKEIENEILGKLNGIGKELDKINPELNPNIELGKSGLFNWYGKRVYKFSLAKDNNKIWVQFVKEEIHLYSNYYLEEETDGIFEDILEKLNINKNVVIDHNKSKKELENIFLNQVKLVNDSFKVYEQEMALRDSQ